MHHTINIEGMNFHAFHGCLPEEAKIGGKYTVDVFIETDFTSAALHDDLKKTIDYCTVYEICKIQMKIRSKLIEAVGERIFKELKLELKNINALHIKVTKWNPPINGEVDKVSIEIKEEI